MPGPSHQHTNYFPASVSHFDAAHHHKAILLEISPSDQPSNHIIPRQPVPHRLEAQLTDRDQLSSEFRRREPSFRPSGSLIDQMRTTISLRVNELRDKNIVGTLLPEDEYGDEDEVDMLHCHFNHLIWFAGQWMVVDRHSCEGVCQYCYRPRTWAAIRPAVVRTAHQTAHLLELAGGAFTYTDPNHEQLYEDVPASHEHAHVDLYRSPAPELDIPSTTTAISTTATTTSINPAQIIAAASAHYPERPHYHAHHVARVYCPPLSVPDIERVNDAMPAPVVDWAEIPLRTNSPRDSMTFIEPGVLKYDPRKQQPYAPNYARGPRMIARVAVPELRR